MNDFEVRISLKRKVYLFSATVIFFLIDSISIFSFLIVGLSPVCHVFEFTIQVMLSIAVDSASIIWNVAPIGSTMTKKTEFIGGPTVQRCFISVFKYLHANFAILLEMTELKADNNPLQKVFFKGV